jgi:hypothetical protein
MQRSTACSAGSPCPPPCPSPVVFRAHALRPSTLSRSSRSVRESRARGPKPGPRPLAFRLIRNARPGHRASHRHRTGLPGADRGSRASGGAERRSGHPARRRRQPESSQSKAFRPGQSFGKFTYPKVRSAPRRPGATLSLPSQPTTSSRRGAGPLAACSTISLPSNTWSGTSPTPALIRRPRLAPPSCPQ